MVLDQFLSDVANKPAEEKESIDLNIANNPKINKDLLKNKIIHNIEMSDEELAVLVRESYPDILSCIFEMNDLQYLQFVTTPRFIRTLSSVISTKKELPHITKVHINKLIYDYLTYHGNTSEDSTLNTMMVNLATIVNRENIRKLIGVGVNADIAEYLALARYSSTNEAVNIRRVNFIICTTLDKEFNMEDDLDRARAEQIVVDIYSKIFNRITVLFEATMFDCYNLEETWVTESVSEMYSITTLAILDIVDNLPIQSIRSLLITYTGDYHSVYGPKGYSVRRSLRSLSSDYSRINSTVSILETEKIFVP